MYVYTYMLLPNQSRIFIYVHMYIRIYVDICIHVYMYVCVCVCVYACPFGNLLVGAVIGAVAAKK